MLCKVTHCACGREGEGLVWERDKLGLGTRPDMHAVGHGWSSWLDNFRVSADRKMAEREEALQSSSGSYGSEAEPEKDTAYEYLCRLEEAKK